MLWKSSGSSTEALLGVEADYKISDKQSIAFTNYPYPSGFLNPQPAWPVTVACGRVTGAPLPKKSVVESVKDFFGSVGNSVRDTLFGGHLKAAPTPLPADSVTRLQAMYEAASVYFNYTNNTKTCTDISDVGGTGKLGDGNGWNALACNELAMPQSANGVTDMFLPDTWSYKDYNASCVKQFGLQT